MKLSTRTAVLALPLALVLAAARTEGRAPAAEPLTFAVDSGHSIVLFKIRHAGVANFYGTFDRVSGEVVYTADDLAACSVKVEVAADSVDSNNGERDALLKSADFFDSANHATWTFESTKVSKGEGDTLDLAGRLTMKGVTKEIEAVLEVVGEGEAFGGQRAGWEARFTIDRNDFGISGVPVGLGKEVEVVVALEGAARKR